LITDSKFIERYVQDNPDEVKILNEFLSKDGLLDNRNENILKITLQKLAKKKKNHSLFSGNHQLTGIYKNLFKRYLQRSIQNTNEDYYDDIRSFFDYTNKLEERIYKRTIENKKYDFKALNNWFAAFILAVDKDINNENSKSDWQKADDLFSSKIPDKYKRDLKQRPEARCWFERNGNKYVAKQGKDFDEDGWNALLRRTQRDNFYDFKHDALISLLKAVY
jgi:hypothetical protein